MNTDIPELPNASKRYYGERAGVVNLFLSLYKHQSGVSQTAPAEVIPMNPDSEGPDFVYELRVNRNQKWESRRMTVSPIGESGGTTKTKTRGSKSVCFKVIYDDLLVVKIPPFPITDFREYVKNIDAEGNIAIRLSPEIEFVAPGVTAVMRKVRSLDDTSALSPSETEKQYIRWLLNNPEYQEYLKIAGAFVFFMDLSKHSFLSYVVEKMHDEEILKDEIARDIIKSHDLLWDIMGFEGKYGSENISLCFNINKIYSDYETEARALLKKYNITSVSPYEKQEWFLFHLAKKQVQNSKDVSEEFLDELNESVRKILDNNKEDIESYRKAVKKYVTKVMFKQNKLKMGGIIANVLRLLASLKKRGIAIRDLKPDNLFVVGNPDENPLVLESTELSSLGLIDFETAVAGLETYKARDKNNPKTGQPLLGGTPSYCSPSHLFPNGVLEETLGNLARTLYFQDWQASIAMIYNVITGDTLFEKTRKLLSRVRNIAQKAVLEKRPLTDAFKSGSQIYWSSAVSEFKEKLSENGELLKAVDIFLPEDARKMVWENMVTRKKSIERTTVNYIKSQVIFSSNKNRNNLWRCSPEDIGKYRKKWEKGESIPKTPPEIRKQIVKFLQGLEYLKLQLEEQNRLIKLIEDPGSGVSAYDLAELMFEIVFKAMYREKWGKLSVATYEHAGDEPKGEATILYEATIMYEATI
ncbi:MAG: hypothetical protein GY795_48705 [Desulfobacterales bacterium]|nr:hypothetical protein [Desulfobacterales bacterium]